MRTGAAQGTRSGSERRWEIRTARVPGLGHNGPLEGEAWRLIERLRRERWQVVGSQGDVLYLRRAVAV